MSAKRVRPADNRAHSKITGEAIGPIVGREADILRNLLTQALNLLTPRSRCRRCGHPLTAERSVRRGMGPVCLRAEGVPG